MKKLYALCLLTLAAVAVDVFLFHAAPVEAQTTGAVGRVNIAVTSPANNVSVNVTDKKFLGFSCFGYSNSNQAVCYIATGN